VSLLSNSKEDKYAFSSEVEAKGLILLLIKCEPFCFSDFLIIINPTIVPNNKNNKDIPIVMRNEEFSSTVVIRLPDPSICH
jgi:hypothetical protein